jgi:DNA polymerase III subunit epsilon
VLYTSRLSYTPALEPYEFNERALIIDTETLGAGPEVEVIEVAACDSAGRVLFQTLVRPAFNRLPPPSKHRRFESEDFSRAPYWPDVWPEFSALVAGRLLVAYNAAFDRRALAAECARRGLESQERGWRCVMPLVKKALGAKRAPTLSEACARFGVEGGDHRAARDVEATWRLLRKVLGG